MRVFKSTASLQRTLMFTLGEDARNEKGVLSLLHQLDYFQYQLNCHPFPHPNWVSMFLPSALSWWVPRHLSVKVSVYMLWLRPGFWSHLPTGAWYWWEQRWNARCVCVAREKEAIFFGFIYTLSFHFSLLSSYSLSVLISQCLLVLGLQMGKHAALNAVDFPVSTPGPWQVSYSVTPWAPKPWQDSYRDLLSIRFVLVFDSLLDSPVLWLCNSLQVIITASYTCPFFSLFLKIWNVKNEKEKKKNPGLILHSIAPHFLFGLYQDFESWFSLVML